MAMAGFCCPNCWERHCVCGHSYIGNSNITNMELSPEIQEYAEWLETHKRKQENKEPQPNTEYNPNKYKVISCYLKKLCDGDTPPLNMILNQIEHFAVFQTDTSCFITTFVPVENGNEWYSDTQSLESLLEELKDQYECYELLEKLRGAGLTTQQSITFIFELYCTGRTLPYAD